MKGNKILFSGLVIYAFSFVLVAVTANHEKVSGFDCAYLTMGSWSSLLEPRSLLRGHVLGNLAILASGSINVSFAIAVSLRASRRHPRAVALSRLLVLLMIPCSWIVMYDQAARPREGHVLWIIGMLLVLFSEELSRLPRPRRATPGASPKSASAGS
jgi:hypothetical protein